MLASPLRISRNPTLPVLLAAVLTIAACDSSPTPNPDAEDDAMQTPPPALSLVPPAGDARLPDAAGKAVVVRAETLQEDAALRALFGDARRNAAETNPARSAITDPGAWYARWTPGNSGQFPEQYDSGAPGGMQAESAAIATDVSRANSVRFLIATRPADEGYACRICAVALRIAEFERRADGEAGAWLLTGWYTLEPAGSYNTPPAAEVLRLGRENRAFAVHHGYLHMGYAGETTQFIAKVDGEYRPVFQAHTHWSNGGACEIEGVEDSEPCIERNAEYKLLESDQDWYDVRVEIRGTDLSEERREVVSANATERYAFNAAAGEYRLQQ